MWSLEGDSFWDSTNKICVDCGKPNIVDWQSVVQNVQNAWRKSHRIHMIFFSEALRIDGTWYNLMEFIERTIYVWTKFQTHSKENQSIDKTFR